MPPRPRLLLLLLAWALLSASPSQGIQLTGVKSTHQAKKSQNILNRNKNNDKDREQEPGGLPGGDRNISRLESEHTRRYLQAADSEDLGTPFTELVPDSGGRVVLQILVDPPGGRERGGACDFRWWVMI